MLDEKGFSRLNFDDIVTNKITKAKELFGNDIDTSQNTMLGKFIRLCADDEAQIWETVEAVYYSFAVDTAIGVSLDNLVALVGLKRNLATAARHSVTLTGTSGYTVPMGFLVSTESGITFYTASDVTLSGGTGTVYVDCTEAGTIGNVAVGKISEITNPDANVSGVTHTAIVDYGTDEETDEELRNRFHATHAGGGSATVDAIKAEILKVANVTGCSITENATDSTVNGIPPHSFKCYVTAPTSASTDIANAIFSKKPVGIPTVGSKSVTVYDKSNTAHIINYEPTVDVAIKASIKVAVDATFRTDGADLIKASVAEYINSLSNGENVVLSKMYAYIDKIEGVRDVTEIKIAKGTNTLAASNIAIADNEIARTDTTDITVVTDTYAD